MSFSFLEKLSSDKSDEEKDEFDLIKCPNTFDDDSQVDRFFDTHNSTPSPKLRRSQRIKAKLSDGNEGTTVKLKKKTVEPKTPPKNKSSVSSYASCQSSTPYGTPMADMKKATTTPGPPPRSLLKFAIGNSVRNKAIVDETLVMHPKPRKGPRTSTPKQVTKIVKMTKTVKENETPPIVEEVASVKKAPQRKTVVISTAASKAELGKTATKRTFSHSTIKPQTQVPAAGVTRVVAPRIDLASSRTASTKTTMKPDTKVQTKSSKPPARAKKSISEKLAAVKTVQRKSLKTIVKKRKSDVKKTDATKNTVAAARTAASRMATAKTTKRQKTNGEPYAHVKSKVAQMISSGPVAIGPNVRDMKKRAADMKASKAVLHDKPFLPAGKVKYTSAVDVVPGDLTVNGQTMAQFVKNFHYQTPPRYRALKPTDNFQNTCMNHSVQGANPTIPKSPKFATNNRRRNALKQ